MRRSLSSPGRDGSLPPSLSREEQKQQGSRSRSSSRTTLHFGPRGELRQIRSAAGRPGTPPPPSLPPVRQSGRGVGNRPATFDRSSGSSPVCSAAAIRDGSPLGSIPVSGVFGDHPTHAAARILDIPRVPRDEMKMGMVNRLTSVGTDVDRHVETRRSVVSHDSLSGP